MPANVYELRANDITEQISRLQAALDRWHAELAKVQSSCPHEDQRPSVMQLMDGITRMACKHCGAELSPIAVWSKTASAKLPCVV